MTEIKKKILIVEDSVTLLRILTTKLLGEGFDVLEARNGQEGLGIALKQHPDLILLDIVMPKMDGITMLKELRHDEWGQKAVVMVLTNLSYAKETLNEMESGVYDFLVKSNWKLEDVVAKIREKLGVS